MIFAPKINKMPEFYMILAKNIFLDFFFWGGCTCPLDLPLPSPTPMGGLLQPSILVSHSR